MNKRAMLAATAILVGSFNPVLATQAWAATTLIDPVPGPTGPSTDTLDAMQAVCDTKAAAHDTANGDIWTGEVVQGAVSLVSGPTEVGTHTYAANGVGEQTAAGTFTAGSVSILGDPYRNGGSVNMFGVQQSTGGHYSASSYDFRNDFETKYSYAFSCDIYKAVHHDATVVHHAAEGIYVIAGDFGDSEDAVRGNCAAFTAQGDNDPLPDWWGEPFHGGNPNNPHCRFEGTPASDEDVPETWDDPVLVGNEAADAIEETQTDELLAHEDNGEGFDISETVLIGQVVICISPSTTTKKGVPGVWKQQNGYTGNKCTTAWFNVAPWGHGSQDSNGTYISVPLA